MDYVEAMWKMLQQKKPEDFVISSGKTHTVKEFAQKAFKAVDLDWEKYVKTSEKYMRPNEVNFLLGDYSKAKNKLKSAP